MNMRKGQAFTLLEITVVLVILSVITAMAIPSFIGFYRETESVRTTQQLTSLLRFAHQEAIFRRERRTVAIDFESQSYYILSMPEPGEYGREIRKRNHTPLPDGFRFESVVYPKREEEVDFDEAFVNFFPDGTADKTKILISRVDDDGYTEKEYTIIINEFTGNVKIDEEEEDEDYYG